MTRSVDTIAADFDALTPHDFDCGTPHANGYERLEALCDEMCALNEPAVCAPVLFRTMERLEGVDLGTPGPIVHTLESWRGGYEAFLAESVGRKPVPLTVWMVHRILNAQPPDAQSWLGLLRSVTDNPSASPLSKAQAAEFIDQHRVWSDLSCALNHTSEIPTFVPQTVMARMASSPATTLPPKQVVTGVVPPQLAEAVIREAWPALTGSRVPGLALLAQGMIRSIILAPVGWLLLAPLFIKKITPVLGKKYVLTNRRVGLVRFGFKEPYRQIALADIDDVQLEKGSYSEFYRTGTLEIWSKGQVAMRLRGVPEPEGFRRAIINACKAWVPDKNITPPDQLATADKSK